MMSVVEALVAIFVPSLGFDIEDCSSKLTCSRYLNAIKGVDGGISGTEDNRVLNLCVLYLSTICYTFYTSSHIPYIAF